MAGGEENRKIMPEVDGYTQVKSNAADIMGMEMSDPHLKSLQQRLFHIEQSQIIPPSQKQAMIMDLYKELIAGHFTNEETAAAAVEVLTEKKQATLAERPAEQSKVAPQYGADTGVYRWEQDELEVTVEIPVPGDATAKNIAWSLQADAIKVGIVGEAPILEGALCASVVPDDCEWQLEKAQSGSGKLLTITLTKAKKTFGAGHWNCIIKGLDCVDTSTWALDP